MISMRTYCFKLYQSKRNRKLHRQINAAGIIYNHCISLHKRYYRLYKTFLNVYTLQKHLTKLKKIEKHACLKEIGSQAVQDITERIDRAYKLFFRNLKHQIRTAPPSFKKIRKYKSYTLKQAGWKLFGENAVRIGKEKYRYFLHKTEKPSQKQIESYLERKTVQIIENVRNWHLLGFIRRQQISEVIFIGRRRMKSSANTL